MPLPKKTFKEATSSPHRNTLQKQNQPSLPKGQDEFTSTTPIKMMGGEFSSQISSQIKINQMSSGSSDYNPPMPESEPPSPLESPSNSDRKFHKVKHPKTLPHVRVNMGVLEESKEPNLAAAIEAFSGILTDEAEEQYDKQPE